MDMQRVTDVALGMLMNAREGIHEFSLTGKDGTRDFKVDERTFLNVEEWLRKHENLGIGLDITKPDTMV